MGCPCVRAIIGNLSGSLVQGRLGDSRYVEGTRRPWGSVAGVGDFADSCEVEGPPGRDIDVVTSIVPEGLSEGS